MTTCSNRAGRQGPLPYGVSTAQPLQLVHLHSPADVRQLAPLVHELLTRLGQFRDITLDPEYFLLSLPPHWSAEVLAFFDGTTLQAVLYGRRRKVGGWGTGFLNGGDAVGGGCLAGDPAVLPTVVRQAADYYFKKRVHALRWSFAFSAETVGTPEAFTPKGVCCRVVNVPPCGEWLPLAPNYPAFLRRLSKLMRRNFVYYRRRAEAAGFRFDAQVPFEEYAHRIRHLGASLGFPVSEWQLQSAARLMTHFGGGWCAGLRGPDGSLETALCGFGRDHVFNLLGQFTNRAEARRSLGLVLRGHLIESLIARGDTDLRYLHGLSFLEHRYCTPHPLLRLDLDRPRPLATPLKWVCARVVQALPPRNRRWADILDAVAGSYGNTAAGDTGCSGGSQTCLACPTPHAPLSC